MKKRDYGAEAEINMKDYIREEALYIEWKVTIYINVSNRMVKTVLFYGEKSC